MGFSEARSKKALKHFKNNFETAMAYMLNDEESNDGTFFGREQAVSSLRLANKIIAVALDEC